MLFRRLLTCCACFTGLLFGAEALAQIRLSPLLREGAILQRDQPIPIAGSAPAHSLVDVAFDGESQQIQAKADGSWMITLRRRPVGGPHTLSVSAGKYHTTVTRLLMGDVWIGSGQSNMEMPLKSTDGAAREIARANSPTIRFFKVPLTWSPSPSARIAEASWAMATSKNVGDFSAVAYYFAKEIQRKAGVPIGIISSNWSGSSIEAWMSPVALGKNPLVTEQAITTLVADAERGLAAVREKLRQWPDSLVDTLAIAPPSPSPNGHTFNDSAFSDNALNGAPWSTIEVPGLWEQRDFPGMDGVVWYRRVFTLSRSEATQDATIGLGRIDDNDTTWVNGKQVGTTRAYDQVRKYGVPARLLREGTNQLTIRVEDTGGGGGLYSDKTLFYVQPTGGQAHPLHGAWQFRPEKVTLTASSDMHHTATALYNKMIYPLYNTPIKGVLWYQGESNAGTAAAATQYADQFQRLISQWRRGWKQPDLPFYWVQLASFDSGTNTATQKPWAILRESQTAALALPHTGQAITLDVGNAHDIHPRDKQTVGLRLARIALNKTYGQKKVHFRGPVLQSIRQTAHVVVIQFTTTQGLRRRLGHTELKGFDVVDAAGTAQPVKAVIVGNTVRLALPATHGAALALRVVRYAWNDNPEQANLEDLEGLPAEPFRFALKH